MTLTPNQLDWIRNGERGISSEAIFEVCAEHPLLDSDHLKYNFPRDPSDFNRCYKLLKQCQEFNAKLSEVYKIYPCWKVFIDNWDRLTNLFEEEFNREDGRAPKLYKFMEILGERAHSYAAQPQNVTISKR